MLNPKYNLYDKVRIVNLPCPYSFEIGMIYGIEIKERFSQVSYVIKDEISEKRASILERNLELIFDTEVKI